MNLGLDRICAYKRLLYFNVPEGNVIKLRKSILKLLRRSKMSVENIQTPSVRTPPEAEPLFCVAPTEQKK